MKSTSTLLLSLAMAAQLHGAEPFTLSFDFDAASDFATGWNYEDAGMIHETADYFGAPDATGTNMVFVHLLRLALMRLFCTGKALIFITRNVFAHLSVSFGSSLLSVLRILRSYLKSLQASIVLRLLGFYV